MSNISTITVTFSEMRPCVVTERIFKGRKDRGKTVDIETRVRNGWFHTWEHYAKPVPPSMMIPGDNGGQVSRMYGLVEFEDGTVERIEPYEIRFTDGGFQDDKRQGTDGDL